MQSPFTLRQFTPPAIRSAQTSRWRGGAVRGASGRSAAARQGEMLKPFADKLPPEQTVLARVLLEDALAAPQE